MKEFAWIEPLKKLLSVPVEEDKLLAPLSTLHVGGSAEYFVEPSEIDDVRRLFEIYTSYGPFPLYILGGGSNVVFADGLVSGVVLSARKLNSLYWNQISGLVSVAEVQSGYNLASLVSKAVVEGLGGLEFALGIPGTIGGALAGNAGAAGLSVGDLLENVTSVELDGSLRIWERGEFSYSYRNFSLADEVRFLVSCKLILKARPRIDIENDIERFRLARGFQPKGCRSAGCTFKNPVGDSAGRLLDECGCKGMRVGGAVVSHSHANFIINDFNATASDVFYLALQCREAVYRQTGIKLYPEIKFLAFSDPQNSSFCF